MDPVPTNQAYSNFSKPQRRWIVILAALSGSLSTLSSFIYFPAIPTISRSLDTSVEKINLTVTSYLILAALAPSIVGRAADTVGRRLILIVALLAYTAINVGLALQSSFSALLVLRMFQAASVSGIFSVAYGIVADIEEPSERGFSIGILSFGTNLAPSVGPLLGGLLTSTGNWRWIFWFLTILSAFCLVAVCVSLPETSRNIVGSGSTSCKQEAGLKFSNVCNPIPALAILCQADSFLVITPIAILYMAYTCVQVTLGTLFVDVYGLNDLQSGLVYLPFGIGCAIMALCTGKLLDRGFERTAVKHGLPKRHQQHFDMSLFPIEEARLQHIWYPLLAAVGIAAGYGWTIKPRIHIAVPLLLQFLQGAMFQTCFTTLNTLLVDIHVHDPATAQASANLVRCLLAAGCVAVVEVVLQRLSSGLTFSIIAAAVALVVPLLFAERIRGQRYRQARRSRELFHESPNEVLADKDASKKPT